MRFKAIILTIALLILAGCDDGSTGPTTEEFNQERKALLAKLEKKKKEAPKVAEKAVKQAPKEEILAIASKGFIYDATGLRDPFRSFTWDERSRRQIDEAMRGPLEQYDISQLSVLGVVWNTGSARALVQDPAGKSYIIGKGTRIGKNDGRVIDIGDNQVVVKETYVDFLGNETTKDIEMHVRRSEGG